MKIAFIGAGYWANRVHYPSLNAIEEAEIVGISDLVREKREETAQKYGVGATYENYREMIEKTSPDAVYVIMPPHHTYDIVHYCLDAGLNVFVEKPPGITLEQTRQMANTAEKRGCLTMTGFQRRFAPAVTEARKKVDERGGVLQCQAKFFKYYLDQPPFYDGATGILTCDAIHSVDVLRFLGGEPSKVVSSVRSLFADYDNSFCAMIEFQSGAIGFLSTSWVSGKRIYSIEMHGKGICAFVDPETSAFIYKDGSERGQVLEAAELAGGKELFLNAGFYHENRHFIDCIKTGTQPQTNFADGVKTMELIDRIARCLI